MTDQKVSALLALLNEMERTAYEYPAPDYAAYRERVGRYQGIQDCIQVLNNLEDDEDSQPHF